LTALDTSVVVAALASWHEAHERSRRAADGASIPAHALIESYAVLTRLPPPHRLAAPTAGELLAGWFPSERVLHLDRRHTRSLLGRFATADLDGGAAYDGLVAVTAAAHDHVLLTRDARAVRTYERLGVTYQLID
jgi:predicted nucleic acid-binding protein